jgi:glutathione synthase/RimK-type ligase-like ATP-grasp enzyme
LILSTLVGLVTGMTVEVGKNRQVPRILLATFILMPEGEPDGHLVTEALARHGVEATWAAWDDPSVDWSDTDLVAVRSTWDYHRRTAQFLAWARDVESRARLLNGADVFAWNSDKAYLVELAKDVPCVPTDLLDDRTLVDGLAEAARRWDTVVIKPRVGASGIGVVVATGVDDERLQMLAPAPWVVQPLVESVRTVGETSIYVFSGHAVSQVDKRAAGDEVRVHEAYGGSSVAVPLDPERAALAEAAVASVGARRGREPAYARIDVMLWEDAWVVSELELIEPGLYLDVDPRNAEHFADLVASLL